MSEQVIIHDKFDPDIYHLGYRWQRGHIWLQRLAATIHVDDIEGLFGSEILEQVKKIPLGTWDYIYFGAYMEPIDDE